jgi:predicted regulator of Ras-like GTPase activity (Roadblock/LC7/MglB family)
LQANAGVRCVLLISSEGYPVQVVGQTEDFEVKQVSALVAANFLAAAELANLLGNRTVFKSSYHEGDNYNIYAHDVNGQLLLALVFEAKLRPGSVWFYTKQTAMVLAQLLDQPS